MNEEGNESESQIQAAALILPSEFEVLEKIGEGAHGIVFRALNKILQSQVAIKVIRQKIGGETALKHFQNEVRVAAQLSHPNIVKVLQVGFGKDDSPFIVYEYLAGETLAEYLCKKKNLNNDFLEELFFQIADALSHAHGQGIIHRDLKPSNIMILKDAEVQIKLLDFGVAQKTNDPQSAESDSTSSWTNAGSPAYMSPEQCKGEELGKEADIYALGAILFECLLGEPPFTGDSAFHVLYKQINEAAPVPNKRLSRALNKLLQNALNKDPSKRPNSAMAFSEELGTALGGPSNNSARRNLLLLTIAALAILAAGAELKMKQLIPVENEKPKPKSVIKQSPRSYLDSINSRFEQKRLKQDLKGQLDELRKLDDFIKTQKSPINKLLAYNMQGDFYIQINKLQEAYDAYKNCIPFCTVHGKQSIEALKALTSMASICYKQKKLELANKHAEQALKVAGLFDQDPLPSLNLDLDQFKNINDQESRISIYYIQALIQRERKNLKAAKTLIQKSRESLHNSWDSSEIGRPAILHADIEMEMKNEKEAEQIILQVADELCSTAELVSPAEPILSAKFDFYNALMAVSQFYVWLDLHGYHDQARRLRERMLKICSKTSNSFIASDRPIKQIIKEMKEAQKQK
ncbi:MAG: serine/threonine protein kinase [Candidatus Obscuribacterales bacterium]|nr:serine/threonine protein kinase [Candidatus Obscuribacterales bacterium]